MTPEVAGKAPIGGNKPDGSTQLADRLAASRVIVTAGTGGVGKTTLASAIALAQAELGRRCVVVTIDPAKRLAETLGLAALDNTPRRVLVQVDPKQPMSGELWACMLDTKQTFDDIISAQASSSQAEAIFQNRLYRNISGGLSGTQEYMAAEKVHQLVTDERFDVVVIDTPPASNALDFITAPRRLVRFLDHSLFRLVIAPGKGALRLVSGAAQTLLKPLTQVIGGAAVTDAIEFFRLFDGLEAGFRARAAGALEVLTDQQTAWLLITTSEPEPMRAAAEFADHIAQTGVSVTGAVLNRAEPVYADVSTSPSGAGRPGALGEILADHRARRQRDDDAVASLVTALGTPLVCAVSRFDPALGDGDALAVLSRVWHGSSVTHPR